MAGESNFVDYVKIYLRSGKGGRGSAHFRREKYIPKGGPVGAMEGAVAAFTSRLTKTIGLSYTCATIATLLRTMESPVGLNYNLELMQTM